MSVQWLANAGGGGVDDAADDGVGDGNGPTPGWTATVSEFDPCGWNVAASVDIMTVPTNPRCTAKPNTN